MLSPGKIRPVLLFTRLMAIGLPKSLDCFRTYSVKTFVSDLIAGVTVGLVELPLAMSFAISSGLSSQTGIYTEGPDRGNRNAPNALTLPFRLELLAGHDSGDGQASLGPSDRPLGC